MKKPFLRALFRVYQIVRGVRYWLLVSVFGFTIHCKHTPSCGTFAFRALEKDGILVGGLKGLSRVLRCW